MFNVSKTVIYALITFLILGSFFYSVSSIIAPFLVAIILGYFLAPLVFSLEKRFKIPRAIGAVIALSMLVAFILIVSFTIMPVLYHQAVALIGKAYENKDYLQDLMPGIIEKFRELDPSIVEKVKDYLGEFSAKLLNLLGSILKKLIDSGMVAANIISLVFITPIVLFYALRDWSKLTSGLKSLIPHNLRPKLNSLLKELDVTLSGYIRGQTYVCIVMGSVYAIAFTIIGLDYGIALGFISGLLTFIPYAGALFSGALCLIVAAIQFGVLSKVILVVVIFILGQFLEGNFIVPRLIGTNINVHPVWIIFGLLAGGTLLGFVGVLVALPLTAILSVIIKFLLQEYKKSLFYINKG